MVSAGSNASSFFSCAEFKKLFRELTDDLPEHVDIFSYVSYVMLCKLCYVMLCKLCYVTLCKLCYVIYVMLSL